MDKRYQVFVSSTYEDLQEERKEVMQALLELECIPCGMELFPSSNEDQWSLIKRMIDDCDYYVLIVGGRYGCTNEDGISYTEMEYRYALETKKPIISFLHKNPDAIPVGRTEKSPEGVEKLKLFRELCQKKMTKYWTNPSELGGVVSRSMVNLKKQFPAPGWVKADNVMHEDIYRELLKLQKENDELKQQIVSYLTEAPKGTQDLSQGEDKISIALEFVSIDSKGKRNKCEVKSEYSWNELMTTLLPHLLIEESEENMKGTLETLLISREIDNIKSQFSKYTNYREAKIKDRDFQIIKVQLKALGLIRKSQKNRSVKDTANYWELTEYGDHIMTQLIALKKN